VIVCGDAGRGPKERSVRLEQGAPVVELGKGPSAHQQRGFDGVLTFKPADLLVQQMRNRDLVDDYGTTIRHLRS
jgi:hypothetical protein